MNFNEKMTNLLQQIVDRESELLGLEEGEKLTVLVEDRYSGKLHVQFKLTEEKVFFSLFGFTIKDDKVLGTDTDLIPYTMNGYNNYKVDPNKVILKTKDILSTIRNVAKG